MNSNPAATTRDHLTTVYLESLVHLLLLQNAADGMRDSGASLRIGREFRKSVPIFGTGGDLQCGELFFCLNSYSPDSCNHRIIAVCPSWNLSGVASVRFQQRTGGVWTEVPMSRVEVEACKRCVIHKLKQHCPNKLK